MFKSWILSSIFTFFLFLFSLIDILQAQINESQNCEVIKLSYIKTDYAMGLFKALGYSVIEFESNAGESLYEYQFSPSSVDGKSGLTIIKLPENSYVSLESQHQSTEDEEKGENLASYLGGSSLKNSSSGEPLQRLMVCYDKDKFNQFSSFYSFLKNKIDTAADQVLIEALVIEIDSEELNELGLSVGHTQGDASSNVSTPTENTELGGFDPFSFIYSDGGIVNDLGEPLSYLFEVRLRALLSSKSAEILSKPSVLVLDGRQARIQVGQQIPITRTIAGNGFSESDVEYIPVGIILNLKPRVSEDKRDVTMQVETIITEVAPQDAHQNVASAPTINNRRVESFIRVSNNTPFIIGGLISDKKSDITGGIPILSKIPYLGKLFSNTSKNYAKKEVIVVITPHVITESNSQFSRVIPKDSRLFDSVGNRLFPNSYRLKESDIFDLDFITKSDRVEELRTMSYVYPEKLNRDTAEHIKSGGIPGEDILIRRMLYEIIEKENYFTYMNPDNVIFFNSTKGGGVDFITKYDNDYLKSKGQNGILLSFNPAVYGKDATFVRPTTEPKNLSLAANTNDKDELRKHNFADRDQYSILLTSAKNRRRLLETLVLKQVLAMNPDLTLSINQFIAGLEIQFPAPEILEQNMHVIDAEVARFYYEVNDYYPAFEREFNSVYNLLKAQ